MCTVMSGNPLLITSTPCRHVSRPCSGSGSSARLITKSGVIRLMHVVNVADVERFEGVTQQLDVCLRRGLRVHSDSNRLGAQFLVAMKYALRRSPSTCTTSMEVKPASRSISRAFCSPHIAPRPIPSSARETVMQCMHEIVYRNGPSG